MKDRKNIDPRLKKGMIKITRKNGEVIYVKEEDCNRVSSKDLEALGYYGGKIKSFSELTVDEQRLFSSDEDKEDTEENSNNENT